MTNLINQMFDDLFTMQAVDNSKKTYNTFRVPVNILESNDNFKLQLVIPGISKEQINIEVEHLTLTVSYDAKKSESTDKTVYLRQDFTLPSFKRSFNLSENINTDELKAQFENGILNITLPKKSPIVPEKKQLIIE